MILSERFEMTVAVEKNFHCLETRGHLNVTGAPKIFVVQR